MPLHSKHQCHVGWRQGGVQNAWVWSGASMPPFCQATADPAKIALASLKNLEVGKYYFFATEPLKVYKFESIDATKAVLLHKPFFGAPDKKEIQHKDLKGLKLWAKPMPTLQPAEALNALQPSVCMMAEFGRAKAQHLLYQKYQELFGFKIESCPMGTQVFCFCF